MIGFRDYMAEKVLRDKTFGARVYNVKMSKNNAQGNICLHDFLPCLQGNKVVELKCDLHVCEIGRNRF